MPLLAKDATPKILVAADDDFRCYYCA